MKFSEVIKGIPGITGAQATANPDVLRVCEDSRKIKPGDLFVARGGTKVSGARFAADAIAKGAVAVLAEEPIDVPPAVAFARTKDANLALALTAHKIAGNPTAGITMLAVTGTKGKTTIAYLIRSILAAAGKKCGLVGTVEIDDGATVAEADMTTPGATDLVELFCRMRNNGVTHCVMEVSSHALHQHRIAGVDFAVGMFTNLTGDHLDYHKTMDAYAAAKAILFAELPATSTAIINIDDKYAERMAQDCRAKVVSYCVAKDGDARPVPASSGGGWTASIKHMASDGMRLRINSATGEEIELETPLVGRHNAYNLLCVIAAAKAVQIPADIILKALRGNVGAPGRLQPVVPQGARRDDLPFQVFVDYAHTHDSLENVLSALRGTMAADGRKGKLICVFGCGGDRDRTKRSKMAAVAEKLADKVIVTSDNPRTEKPAAIIDEITKGFSPTANGKVKIEPDRREAIRVAIHSAGKGDVVLIAGKGHENYQVVGTTKHHFDDVEEAEKAMSQQTMVPGA